ncbi:helix-turn-helix domain-containing protein [Nanoarchaeota archaeon]
METEQALMEVGIPRNHARVYLSLLRVGDGTAGRVAEECKMHRPSCYDVMERLVDRGLASYFLRGRQKIFRASAPRRILEMLREKQKRLEEVMPVLELERELNGKVVAEVGEELRSLRREVGRLKGKVYVMGLREELRFSKKEVVSVCEGGDATTIVCGDKIIMVGWEPVTYVKVKNKSLADMQKRLILSVSENTASCLSKNTSTSHQNP